MTEEQAERLEQKLDTIIDALPALEALGELLVEADLVTKTKGLNPKTISKNNNLEKYQAVGKRKLLLKLSTVPVIRQRKPKK